MTLKPSSRKDKKYQIQTPSGKTVHFGAKGYSDFTQHKDPKRKQAYILRHQAREDWRDPETAGFWAKNLLWNKTTLSASLKDTIRRFPKLNYLKR
jgi:hypothetical protein